MSVGTRVLVAGLLADVDHAVVAAVFPIALTLTLSPSGRLGGGIGKVVFDFMDMPLVTILYFARVAVPGLGPMNDMVIGLVMVRYVDGASSFLNNYRLSLANDDGMGWLLGQSGGLCRRVRRDGGGNLVDWVRRVAYDHIPGLNSSRARNDESHSRRCPTPSSPCD
jgi:hypothetical protein